MGEIYSKGLVMPGVRDGMLSPGFWTARMEKVRDVIMTPRQIEEFNREVIRRVDAVHDLRAYKEITAGDEVAGYVNAYRMPEKTMYDARGKEITAGFYDYVRKNMNTGGIKEKNPVGWGIAVRKTSLRSFPTAEGVFDTCDNTEIDRFQETGVQACEPVLILHRSRDGRWCFVQTETYRGWVTTEDIAVAADKEQLFSYLDSPEFLVVTGNWVGEYDMGARIPAVGTVPPGSAGGPVNHMVKLPVRTGDGRLQFRNAVISGAGDMSRGYLPYTGENVIRQAFKLLGDRYDWGNRFKGRDCSSFIRAVYKTFGFNLPRNAGEQEKGPGRVFRFKAGDNIAKRSAVLDRVKPGAVIFMPGHVMMYLGRVDGGHYIIHDFTGYGKKDDSGWTFVPVYRVAVTSTLLPTASGTPFIENFTTVLEFAQDVLFGFPE